MGLGLRLSDIRRCKRGRVRRPVLLRTYTDDLFDSADPKKSKDPKPYRFEFPTASHYDPATIKWRRRRASAAEAAG